MIRSVKAAAIFSGALMFGIFLGAQPNFSRAYADESPASAGPPAKRSQSAPPPIDPKKKLPGDACKTSDECQNHHTCEKVGDKYICKAPPPRILPPGAVT